MMATAGGPRASEQRTRKRESEPGSARANQEARAPESAETTRPATRRSAMSASPAQSPVVAQLVETMRALAGSHPGFRPAHAKGIVCSGTFRGAPEARRVSRAPHLQGQLVPTVIRFSTASGNPDVLDGLAKTRSLSVKSQLS